MDSERPLQSTCAWLLSHADQQPDTVAVTAGRISISYRNLACDIVRTMQGLAAAGIQPKMVVGVEVADRLLHLLLLLACEALGVTTISLLPFDLGPPMNLGRLCDRILVSQPLSGPDADKTLAVTQEWIVQTMRFPIGRPQFEALRQEFDRNGLVRLIKSSGTTGVPKVMGMTHRAWQRTIQTGLDLTLPRTGPHLRFLCLYHLSVRGCHRRVWAALQLGGTVELSGMDAAWNSISSGVANHGLFIAGDAVKLIRDAPSDAGPFDFHIDVIGSAVSAGLRREIQSKFIPSVLVTYSSNECAQVSIVDENNVGTLVPGVQIKICDAAGKPVPLGQSGLVRIKSDAMVTGYVDDPELSCKTFIDGWFHTNDLGYQPSSNELVVQGRADDVLNIGGMKIAASQIEEEIRAIPGVLDASVIQALNAVQLGMLVVAVETGPGGGSDHLPSLIDPIILQFTAAFQLLRMDVFPRTETGKIRREAIQDAYQQSITGPESSLIAGTSDREGLA